MFCQGAPFTAQAEIICHALPMIRQHRSCWFRQTSRLDDLSVMHLAFNGHVRNAYRSKRSVD